MRFARSYDVIRRPGLLQDPPNRLHVVARIAPIPASVQIAHEQLVLNSDFDSRRRLCNFSGHERFATPWRFMIEKNSVSGEYLVPLAVVHRHPMRVELRGGIRTPWVK